MKQQSVGIVLCALLLTTFGNDILNRHHAAHSARLAHPAAKSKQLEKNNNDSDDCEHSCEQSGNDGNKLSVAIDPKTSTVLAVYNSSAQIGLAIDLQASSVGILNHSSKKGIVINYQSETVVTINVDHEVEFPFLINKNISLGHLCDQGHKISKEEASKFIRESLILLSAEEYSVSESEAWDLIIHLSRALSVSLKILIKVIDCETFTVDTTLNRVVEVVNGFASVILHLDCLKDILEHHVTISLKALLQFKSSLEIAGYLWEKLSNTDIERIFHGLDNSVEVFQLISGLSANSTTGVNGFISLLAKLVLFVNGQESLYIVSEVLVEVVAKNKGNTNIVQEWRSAVDSVYKLLSKCGLENKLKFVCKLLGAIRERHWSEGGVDFSAIIKDFEEGIGGNSLKLVVHILNCLKAKTSIEIAIATLVLHFVELFTVRGGVQVLSIVADIKITREIEEAGSGALTLILRGITVQGLWDHGIARALKDLPVIKEVVEQLDIQLKAIRCEVSVAEALQSHNSRGIQRIILEVFESALKHIEPVNTIGGSGPEIPHTTPSQEETTIEETQHTESSYTSVGAAELFPSAPAQEESTEGGGNEQHGDSEDKGDDKGEHGEDQHYGKITIDGLTNHHGNERSNVHKLKEKHAIHGKFHHSGQGKHHEKHHQQHEKHYQDHEKLHQGHEKQHLGHEKHHQEHEKHRQEHGKHDQKHGKLHQAKEKRHAHEKTKKA